MTGRAAPWAVAAVAAISAACLLTGCGGAGGSLNPTGSTGTSSSATRSAMATSTTSSASLQTTTSSVTTASSTQSVLLSGTGRRPVVVGDMNTPEQFVLGELYAQALGAQGFTVTITRNIGAVPIRLRALVQGTLDMYPEYLNVWDASIAGETGRFPSEADAYAAGQTFAETHGLELLTASPASDTAGLAVSTEFGEASDLHTLADLRSQASAMTFGVPPEFAQSPQGLVRLEHTYRFAPETVKPIDLGDQYADLQAGTIQAAYVNSTDPELASDTFRLLADPLHVLGFGNIVPVVTQAAIADEGPSFAATIDSVSALLSTRVLRQLNGQLANMTPQAVAKAFLQAHSIIPASPPS